MQTIRWCKRVAQSLGARSLTLLCGAFFLLGVPACAPKSPIAIGFIGGLSGKFSDLGTATRNGALLAIENANDAGGVEGRKLVLFEQDDKQSSETALLAMEEFKKQGVVAVVGPSTSSIAVAVTPVANQNHLLLVAPTATTNKLSGKDDYFMRSVGDAAFYGRAAAQRHYAQQAVRSVALILDMANADYTESWGDPYAAEFKRLGGVVTLVERFNSTANPDHIAIAKKLVASAPQMVVTVASSVDSAMIAQRVRSLKPGMRLAGAGWASTERLIELGGAAVEGMLFEQYFDRFDPSVKFQGFLKAYRNRFKAEPGFGAVLAFDAANMIIGGLGKTDQREGLKAAVLGIRTFEGAQNPITLDAFGDVTRDVYFGVVKNGAFAKLQ
ncbi:MAG: ABC transporter substrate-binding protein [Burkholderiales bacterium]